MNRNLNSHFAKVPRIDVQRSVIDVSSGTSTTANAGDLVPFFCTEVLPGGTYSYDTSFVARLTPSVHATMDNCFIDFYYFFVPSRICWDDWKHFMGEPVDYWSNISDFTVPQIKFPSGGWNAGSIADHFGLPTYVDSPNSTDDSNYITAIPFLGYCRIFNEFFRDENLQAPVYCPSSTTALSGLVGWQSGSSEEIASPLEGAMHGATLLKACKPHDYFTSCLPSPQRGPDVTLPISSSGSFPVVTGSGSVPRSFTSSVDFPMRWRTVEGNNSGLGQDLYLYGSANSSTGFTLRSSNLSNASSTGQQWVPENLYALANSSVTATINDMRYAFALQHLYEDLARSGSRYREIIRGIFGVSVDDPNHDIPHYLGGKRVPVSMNSVVQTSETNTTAQGNVTGYSHTTDNSRSFTYSAVESGYIIGVFTIRQPKTYQQGVNRMWRRRDRFSFFWPEFANIGEQKVRKDEIYFASETGTTNSDAFGYQEAWAEYRYHPYTVTGMFRSNYPGGTLDSWHYADYYTSRPQLSDTWIEDNSRANIDRTLSVQSSNADQFLIDIAWKATHVVPMPVYSIPGLSKL